MTSGCLFCRVVAGDEPAHVVMSDEISMAFLDTRPLFVGHTLLVDLARGLVGRFDPPDGYRTTHGSSHPGDGLDEL